MVQSNSSERVQKNNGNYAKFPIPSMWYKKGLSSDYVISVERVSHGTPRVITFLQVFKISDALHYMWYCKSVTVYFVKIRIFLTVSY